MKTWSEEKLGKLIKIKHGFAFKGEFFSDSGNYVLLTPGNIYPSGGIKLKGEKEKYYLGEFPSDYLMKTGDLLVVMTDLTQTASILGGALVIPEDGKYLHNQRLGLVTIKDEKELDKNFLYCYLNWQYFRDQVKASSNGATVKHTSPDRIYKCKINLPPLPIQQKIAAILSAYDDLIENNNKRIALLEKAAEEIYREWFVRMRFPGWEQVKFVKGIPEGWEYNKISKVCDTITSGGTPNTNESSYWDGEIPWLSSGETRNRFIIETEKTITQLGVDNSSTRLAKSGTIVIASAGQGNTRGQTSLLLMDTYINQSLLNLSARLVSNYYLFSNISIRYEELRLKSDAFSSRGSLTTKLIGSLDILVPTKKICSKFDVIIESIVLEIKNLQLSTSRLKSSRNLLLSRLISGKLSVEALDIRFPLSMIAQ